MCWRKRFREGIEKYNKEKGEGSKSEGILPVNTSLQIHKKNKVQSSTDWKKII